MANNDDHDFQGGNAEAALTFLVKGSGVKKGSYAMVSGHPCKIVDTSTSKTGKHGSAKVHLTGIDIFTSKKHMEIYSSTGDVPCPHVSRKEYNLVDIDDGYLSLMDDDGECRDDVKLPDSDMGKKITEMFEKEGAGNLNVTLIAAVNQESVIECKSLKA